MSELSTSSDQGLWHVKGFSSSEGPFLYFPMSSFLILALMIASFSVYSSPLMEASLQSEERRGEDIGKMKVSSAKLSSVMAAIYAKAITRAYLRCLDSLAPEIRQRYVIGCLVYPVYCNQPVTFLYSLRDSRS